MYPGSAHIFLLRREQGVVDIRSYMEDRACDLAAWIIENASTVRAAAGHFGISKSTVHKDITQRLPACNRSLYLEETDGWMECEHCGNTVQLMKYIKTRRIPCYQMKDCQVLVPLPQK